MTARDVVIEMALNGPWSRKLQPNIPLSPDEIIRDAVECAKAGASIIHFHAYDENTGEQTTDYAVVSRIVEEIRSRTDAIVYPAIRYMSNAEAIEEGAGAKRYFHLEKMASEGNLEWLIVDPGSTNLVTYREITEGRSGVVDINTTAAVRWALSIAAMHRLHPGFAIYEPGYLRLAAALSREIPGIPAPMYRFVFSDQMTFGFRPAEYALRAYLSLLSEEAPGAPWMVAGLGVDITHLIPVAVENGGHIRVGLEDAHLGLDATNMGLLEDAVKRVQSNGGRVATAQHLRSQVLRVG